MADALAGLNIDFGGIWAISGQIAQFVAGGIILIVIVLLMRYFFKYNKAIILLVKAGDGWTIKKDKANINIKKREITLMTNKHLSVSMPHSQNIFLDKGKEMYIGIVKDNSIGWSTVGDNPKFIPADMNMMNFVVDMYARIDEATKTKQGFWDKYGHQILWGISMMVFLVIIILILQRMDKIISMGNVASGQIAQAKQVL